MTSLSNSPREKKKKKKKKKKRAEEGKASRFSPLLSPFFFSLDF
jgi:hypothetical protein